MPYDRICQSKRAFDNGPQARGVAAYMRNVRHQPGLKAYKCKVCGLWHLGRHSKARR